MENPASLLRRAAQFRQHRFARQKSEEPRQSIPVPPRHTSSHASYTALMRSHDRISTRHIAPRNGA